MTGRVALITGCGKPDGMGQAIARALSAAGMAVVVTDVAPAGAPNSGQAVAGPGIEGLVADLRADGTEAWAAVGDISREEDAERMVDVALAEAGRLDVLVNNAAAPQGDDREDVEIVSIDTWDRIIAVNLRGTYLMSRAAVAPMRRQRYGRIVNVASMAGIDALPHSTAYSASKAGVIGFTRALAMDVGGWGITVNAVAPGLVWTSRGLLGVSTPEEEESMRERRSAAIPAARVGAASDIAAAVAFLTSEDAGYITGQVLPVDGGGLTGFPLPRPEGGMS